jgi:hypothetical protein
MTWTYDATRDVLTVTYGRQDRPAARTARTNDLLLYLDNRGDSIRAELLRASTRHPVGQLNSLESKPDDWRGLASAAKRLGVKQFALREEILAGGMPAVKSGPTWLIRDVVLDVYAEILKARRATRAGGTQNDESEP